MPLVADLSVLEAKTLSLGDYDAAEMASEATLLRHRATGAEVMSLAWHWRPEGSCERLNGRRSPLRRC